MIDAAQRKLREAKFFFGHLERERRHPTDPEAFRFYFSAFIEAARSLTWVMKSEETEKYGVWEPQWKAQLTPDEKKLEKVTNELRIDEVKRVGADIYVEMEEIAIIDLFTEAGFKIAHLQQPSTLPGTEIKTKRPKFYLEHEDGKADVIALCKEYLALLEKKVQGFLSAHDKTS